MTAVEVCPAMAIAQLDPGFFERLTDEERLVLAYDDAFWLRPDQRIPRHDWRSYTAIAGRGYGKSKAIAGDINRRIESGEVKRTIALMAPTDDRVVEVQVAFLVETSPPWFRAEAWRGGVRWPNGVVAEAYTPGAPGRTRSGNFEIAWLCELVDWRETTRLEAHENICTATRVGVAQIYQDTTSKGANEVIQRVLANHRRDPVAHVLQRGSTFDNPLLTRKYLRDTIAQYVPGSRRYQEEIEGQVFEEMAGALWEYEWIESNRVAVAPGREALRIVAIDPALSDRLDADETGIAVGFRDPLGECYITADLSERHTPEAWATIAVDACEAGAAGVVLERNHLGDGGRALIKVHAEQRGMRIELVKPGHAFPMRRPGTIFIREVVARTSKESRAEAPAALYRQGRVHHVGRLDALEHQQTNWEPGSKRSPNRLDAAVYLVAELANLDQPTPRNMSREVAQAATAAEELRRRLVRVRPGRLGL